MGDEREESKMIPRLFGLSSWKDGVVINRDVRGCSGASEIFRWVHESRIKGNS